jgi:hypothetical protein
MIVPARTRFIVVWLGSSVGKCLHKSQNANESEKIQHHRYPEQLIEIFFFSEVMKNTRCDSKFPRMKCLVKNLILVSEKKYYSR